MAGFLHYRPVCGRVGRCARWAGFVKRFPLLAALAALVVSLFAAALALAVREVVVGDGLAVDLGAPDEAEDWCELGHDGPSLPVRVPLEGSPVPKLRAVPEPTPRHGAPERPSEPPTGNRPRSRREAVCGALRAVLGPENPQSLPPVARDARRGAGDTRVRPDWSHQ